MPRTPPQPIRPFRLDFTPLAQRRRFLGLTQEDLAKSAGVHRTTVWRTETNDSAPSVAQFVAMARGLGTPMNQLVTVIDIDP